MSPLQIKTNTAKAEATSDKKNDLNQVLKE